MHRLLLIFIIFIFSINPVLCEERLLKSQTDSIKTHIEPILIINKKLRKKYSAYEITYVNESENPIRIDNFRGINTISGNDPVLIDSMQPSGKVIFFCWTPIIFAYLGLPLIFYLVHHQYAKTKDALLEANTYINLNGVYAKNETITPKNAIKLNILTSRNEKPKIIATFEDLKTHQYITVKE